MVRVPHVHKESYTHTQLLYSALHEQAGGNQCDLQFTPNTHTHTHTHTHTLTLYIQNHIVHGVGVYNKKNGKYDTG